MNSPKIYYALIPWYQKGSNLTFLVARARTKLCLFARDAATLGGPAGKTEIFFIFVSLQPRVE